MRNIFNIEKLNQISLINIKNLNLLLKNMYNKKIYANIYIKNFENF